MAVEIPCSPELLPPYDWQAAPTKRKVSCLCQRLGIDPSDLFLLDGKADMLT